MRVRTYRNYCIFFQFSLQILEKWDLEALGLLDIFIIGYIGMLFDLLYETCNNSYTYVPSLEYLFSLLSYHSTSKRHTHILQIFEWFKYIILVVNQEKYKCAVKYKKYIFRHLTYESSLLCLFVMCRCKWIHWRFSNNT